MLWLCIHLPLLALQVVDSTSRHKNTEPRAFAVIQNQQILLCNETAKKSGIEPGLSTSTALALNKKLVMIERNLDQEIQTLQSLAESLYCFSSQLVTYTSRQNESSVLLEVGRSLRLFKGLSNLQQKICHFLQQHPLNDQGFIHQFSLANTVKAATLLARHYWLEPMEKGNFNKALDPTALFSIPSSLLNTTPKVIKQCLDMGLDTVGQLLNLPKAALAKRFDRDFIIYLNQLTGEHPDPQSSITLPAPFEHERFYIDGLRRKAELIYPIEQLLKELCHYLRVKQWQSLGIEWTFQRFSKKSHQLYVSFSKPQHHYPTLLSLTRIKLEQLPLDSPVDTVRLSAKDFSPLAEQSNDFFQTQKSQQNIHLLADKLTAKLGKQALLTVHTYNHHLPEIINQASPIGNLTKSSDLIKNVNHYPLTHARKQPTTIPSLKKLLPLPSWLLANPKRLATRKNIIYCNNKALSLLSEPERIESHWWARGASRDYFIAAETSSQTSQDKRNSSYAATTYYSAFYWIYYDRKNQHWYLQGMYS